MQVIISEDRNTATVGDKEIKVGGKINFKNKDNKIVAGIIVTFAMVDKKVLNKPWCYAKDVTTGEGHWFALEIWAEQIMHVKIDEAKPKATKTKTTPVTQQMIKDKVAAPTPAPDPVEEAPATTTLPNNEISDDDFFG